MSKHLTAPQRLVDGGDGSAESAWAGSLIEKLAGGPPAQHHDEPFVRERVWQRLEARRVATRRRVPWLVAAAVTVVALAVLGVASQLPTPVAGNSELAVVWFAHGKVFARAPDAAPVEAQVGARLVAGSGIHTMADSRAVVRFLGAEPDPARLVLDHDTEATLGRLGHGEVVDLSTGTLVAQVAPREDHDPFVVRVFEYRMTVLGTVFAVEAGSDDLSVAVQAGAVRVDGPGAGVRVNAGQCWSRRKGVAACVEPIEQGLLDLLAGREPTAALAPPPPGAAPAEPARPVHARPAKAKAEAASTDPVQALKERLAHAAQGEEREQLLYELGVILTRLGRYPEALDAFSEVSRGASTHAELALYEVGRIKERYLKDAKGALVALESYRRRYATGVLRQEVDLTLIETLLALGNLDRAGSELDAFLRDYPASERTADVLLLRGNVRRSRGQCNLALADYDATLRLGAKGALADDANYFAAVCAAVLGDRAAARQRLADYLQNFASGLHRAEAEKALTGE